MQHIFQVIFSFEHESPEIDTTLKVVRDRNCEDLEVEIVRAYQNKKRQRVR
jgi:hypothetical protein